VSFTPKVSIIIPVYNGSNYMREAIDSALAQTYNNIEVLVINDGSQDGGATREIALSYGDKIMYFEKMNGGVATALNLGIEKMTGEYFSWLSHDDLYLPEKIESQLNLIKESGEYSTIIFSDWISIDASGKKLQEIHITLSHPDRMEYFFLLDQSIHGCTLLIPRVSFAKAGKFPEDLPNTQDYTLWLKMAEHFRFLHCSKTLVYGRQHEAQGSLILQHKTEVHDFFRREIKRMNSKKITELFPVDERLDACIKIALSMKDKGFDDCAQLFEQQIIDMFTPSEMMEFKQSINRKNLRKIIKSRIIKMRQFLAKLLHKHQGNYQLNFEQVYKNNLFKGDDSLSGTGSNLDQTIVLRRELIPLLKKLDIKTFLDVPCGDFSWMRYIYFEDIVYMGGDIVEILVKENQKQYGNASRHFLHIDLMTSALPKVDAIFCRDCFVHLNYSQIFKAIRNIKKSGATYFMTTTFTNRKNNQDLLQGIWRPLNLQKYPFNFSEPIEILNEECPEGGKGEWMDKCIGVWRIDTL